MSYSLPQVVMPKDYKRLNAMVRKHRSALTRAKNSKDPDKIIAACDAAFADFEKPENIYPDDWSLWQRAKDDAILGYYTY